MCPLEILAAKKGPKDEVEPHLALKACEVSILSNNPPMSRTHLLSLACIASFSSLGICQLSGKQAVEVFQARYDGLTRAYLNKDISAASGFFAPDYVAGDYNRPLNKAKTLDALKNYKGTFQTTSRKVVSVLVNGTKATVISDSIAEGHLADQKGNHEYVIKARTMDTWVRHEQWQLLHARVIRKSITKDGKPVVNRQLGG